ncbi:hypothetical protein GQ53DRAFT_741088 [Thozetella sp. PMI_491]|nr:hypothetical protein GQ53DRAFT_741088 [Thozetella sp. PMI_491]
MDKVLDARFERVEKALANLIDSITKFNPSEKAVEELATADRALNQGLHELQTHQSNHARIQKLRDETAALDAQIKGTTSTLWTMRKEVTGTHTTVYPPGFPKYEFTTAELLNYARRISRNTVPPMALVAEPEVPSEETSRQGTEQPSGEPSTAQTPVGTGTNGVPTNSAAPTPPTLLNGDSQLSQLQVSFSSDHPISQQSNAALLDEVKGMTSLGDETLFIPWPADDLVRRGGLAENRRLQDAGIDPRGYDPAAEERRKLEAEQMRREEEDKARHEAEEAEQRAREERARMNAERAERIKEEQRRGSVIGGPAAVPAAGAPRQFAFADLDDDDEDEE